MRKNYRKRNMHVMANNTFCNNIIDRNYKTGGKRYDR